MTHPSGDALNANKSILAAMAEAYEAEHIALRGKCFDDPQFITIQDVFAFIQKRAMAVALLKAAENPDLLRQYTGKCQWCHPEQVMAEALTTIAGQGS